MFVCAIFINIIQTTFVLKNGSSRASHSRLAARSGHAIYLDSRTKELTQVRFVYAIVIDIIQTTFVSRNGSSRVSRTRLAARSKSRDQTDSQNNLLISSITRLWHVYLIFQCYILSNIWASQLPCIRLFSPSKSRTFFRFLNYHVISAHSRLTKVYSIIISHTHGKCSTSQALPIGVVDRTSFSIFGPDTHRISMSWGIEYTLNIVSQLHVKTLQQHQL